MVMVVFRESKFDTSTPCTPSTTVVVYELALTATSNSSSSSEAVFSPRSFGESLTLGVVPFPGETLALGFGASLVLGVALALGDGTAPVPGVALTPGAALTLGVALALDVGTTLGAALALGVGTVLAPGAALTLGVGISPPRLRYVLISHAPVAPRSAFVKPFTLLHSGESIEALSFFLLRLQQQ